MAISKNRYILGGENVPPQFVYCRVFLCEQRFLGNLAVSLEVKLPPPPPKEVFPTYLCLEGHVTESPQKYKKKYLKATCPVWESCVIGYSDKFLPYIFLTGQSFTIVIQK